MHQQPLLAPHLPKRSSSAGHRSGVSGTIRNLMVPTLFAMRRSGRVAALKSCGRGEADQPLEAIDLRGLDRGRSVDPRDLLHDSDKLTSFFGGESFLEEIREQSRRLCETLRAACNKARMCEALVHIVVEAEHRAHGLFDAGD